MSTRNDTVDVYPNWPAAVVVEQDGQRVLREMLSGFPPFKPGASYGTNFRTLKMKGLGRRLISAQPQPQRGELDHGEKIGGELVIACGDERHGGAGLR
jgi:hypothetical protein